MSKAKKTKRYIIEKTAVLFNKRGYSGTSISDLTHATNLTKGAIYGNFRNKEEVAKAAFNYNYQNLIKRFTSKLNQEKSATGKLTSLLDTYEDYFYELMELGGCPIINNAVDTDDTNRNLHELSIRSFGSWKSSIRKIIETGIDEQTISPEISPERYADLFVVLIEGGLLLAKSTGDKQYFNHAIDQLRQLTEHELPNKSL